MMNTHIPMVYFRIASFAQLRDEEREGTPSLYCGPLLLGYDQKHKTFDIQSISPLNYANPAFRIEEAREEPFKPLVPLVSSAWPRVLDTGEIRERFTGGHNLEVDG